MQKKRGGQWRAILALLTLVITTSLVFVPILMMGLLKLIPIKAWQTRCTRIIDRFVTLWCGCNNFYLSRMKKVQWEVEAPAQLDRRQSYLVLANHQSWLDIVILHKLFNRKIPVLKFFIKDQLKWVPLLGFSWWAMGCPFMKRYSKEYLARKPHKQGKDLLATQKAIRQFQRTPAAIMNFVEGTRFTPAKQMKQDSPYQHLLRPKAGGVGFVLSQMGQQLHSILDVTIVYPEGRYSLWDFLCHRMHSIKVNIRQINIPGEFTRNNLLDDESNLQQFRLWLNGLWQEKDQLITSLQQG